MPVVFRNEKKEPLIIEKDGTKFFFMLSPSVARQAEIAAAVSRESTADKIVENKFCKALIGWENLVDQNGKEVPFSLEVRDFIVNEALNNKGNPLFDNTDVLDVINYFKGESPEKK